MATTLAPDTTVSNAASDSSRPESFVSVPGTPAEPANGTPATTLSVLSEQDFPQSQWQPPADGIHRVVIPEPRPGCKPRTPAPLTAEQQAAYETVLNTVSEWKTVPESTVKNAPVVPMEEREYMWLTRECLLRYLRATKWNVPAAIKRLEATLSWRREYDADNFSADYISPEAETGKQFLLGFDKEGRPCWHMVPARQNTKLTDRQIHFVSYMLDRAIDLMPPGQETVALLVTYRDAARGQVPTVSVGRQALNVLQNHNPERLGRCLMMDWPWIMSGFYKLIQPFIDPLTKEKIKFDTNLRDFVPGEHLWDWLGGDMKTEYDHKAYWTSLTEETARRRAAYRKRWIAGGKMIGEHEAYLRGGDFKSLRETQAETQPQTTTNSASATDTLTAHVASLDVKA